MIKAKIKYEYYNNKPTKIDIKHKKSCTFESILLINALIKLILENDKDLTRKEVYKLIKEYSENTIEEI